MMALHRANLVIGELVLDSGVTSDALSGLFDAPPLDSLLTTNAISRVSAGEEILACACDAFKPRGPIIL